jgi:hypothetical protein
MTLKGKLQRWNEALGPSGARPLVVQGDNKSISLMFLSPAPENLTPLSSKHDQLHADQTSYAQDDCITAKI